jgi:hypothetical protein
VVADTLVLAIIAIVVMLSLRWSAIILILLGLTAIIASLVINAEASPISVIMLRRGGDILTFSSLIWVVGIRFMRLGALLFVGFKAPS